MTDTYIKVNREDIRVLTDWLKRGHGIPDDVNTARERLASRVSASRLKETLDIEDEINTLGRDALDLRDLGACRERAVRAIELQKKAMKLHGRLKALEVPAYTLEKMADIMKEIMMGGFDITPDASLGAKWRP